MPSNRTISTTDEADRALRFLGSQEKSPVSGEDFFLSKIAELLLALLKEADEKQFDLVQSYLKDSKDKGGSLNKLRDLLK